MNFKVMINGKWIEFSYDPSEVFKNIHLKSDEYGKLDLIKKKDGIPEGEVKIINGVFSFIKLQNTDEPFIVDHRDWEKICNVSEIQELRSSRSV